MPIDQPSDFPREALRLHHANLPAPTHFSPVPDTPDFHQERDHAYGHVDLLVKHSKP
jgi:hypothetical protein